MSAGVLDQSPARMGMTVGAAEGTAEQGLARRWQKLRAQVLSEEFWCACGAPVTEAGLVISSGPAERWNLVGQCGECNSAQLSHTGARPE